MNPFNDFSDTLAEEVLTDMADTFFGARKQLEDMIEIFQSLVEELREKEVEVAGRAGFLHYVLLRGKVAGDFYESIKVDSPQILLESKFSDKCLPYKIPFAFTDRGKFTKLVLWAYDALQNACDEYINGKYYDDPEEKGRKKLTIHYKLIKNMCKVINEKVYKVNTDVSPVCVLQYAKKFDPETMEKERIAGATFGGYACSIDEKLAYKTIDFDSLQLKKYPELPKEDKVNFEITLFCKKNYPKYKDEIKKLISDLEDRIPPEYTD